MADAALLVATLNLRNIADRWPERIPLLIADMAALQPDMIGLQECVFAVGQEQRQPLGPAVCDIPEVEGRNEQRVGCTRRVSHGRPWPRQGLAPPAGARRAHPRRGS